jgi:rRNA maturation RNase YbeY
VIDIKVLNDYSPSISYNPKDIENLSKKVLKSEGCSDGNISFILSDKKYLNQLKKKYFDIDVFTDVIAFNLEDENDCLEGEIYISIDDVKENAKIYSNSFNKEFARVLIHGILHLVGYNDSNEKEKEIMTDLENKYLLIAKDELIF